MSEEEKIIKTLQEIIDKGLYIDSTPENTTIEAHEAIERYFRFIFKRKRK